MRWLILFLLLPGCMSMQERKAKNAAQLTSPALCYVVYAGDKGDQDAAKAALGLRGFACQPQHLVEGKEDFLRWQGNQAAADAASRAAAAEAGIRLLTMPPPPAPAKPVQCVTNANGYTTCW